MCTVTWTRTADGYHLLCNRDELHTRRPAQPPRRLTYKGVATLAPTDGDHGGTWIGVNAFGLTLCLLNRYQDAREADGRDYASRGQVVTELLSSGSTAEVCSRLRKFDFRRFRPFSLVALTSRESALYATWDGRKAAFETHADARRPLVSSSYDDAAAAAARSALFAELTRGATGEPEVAALRAFHRSHAPRRGPLSPCMHRADARTVSFSEIAVSATAVSFAYFPQSPCRDDGEPTVIVTPLTAAPFAVAQPV
jgi:hypothetical protein